MDAHSFDHIVALDKCVTKILINSHGIAESRIIELHVDDPYGDELPAYVKCAIQISHALNTLTF
jgi:hypothetical protein